MNFDKCKHFTSEKAKRNLRACLRFAPDAASTEVLVHEIDRYREHDRIQALRAACSTPGVAQRDASGLGATGPDAFSYQTGGRGL